MQDQLDTILEKYDSQIESINKQIDSLKEVKSAWSDIVDNQEFKELEERLKSLFGDDVKGNILSGNEDFLNSVIAQYSSTSDILKSIENATLTDIQNMVAQYGVLPENLMTITNAANDIANAFSTVDVSGFNTSLDNIAQSSDNVAEKVKNVTTSLNDMSNAISSGSSRSNNKTNKPTQNESDNKGTSLESAIQNETQTAIGAFDQHTDKITNEVIPAIHSATDEMNAFNAAADIDIEKTITITYQTSGKPSDNISGNAHVEGTAKVMGDWAVQSNENYALVGEIGRELIVRNGKYFTVGDNGAEMFKIQKGDIVFNHEQTESLLKNGHISGHGKAYADGTVGGGKVITADGTILYPLQPGDRAWEVQKAFEPFINKIISGEMELVNTAMFEHQKQMEELAKQINYVSSITNNRNVQPSINIGDINVTCPGVTSQEVMHEVGDALNKQIGHLSQRAMQEAYKR